ncbi:MAG: cobalamin-dependent protein, partial [Proteobacteria bacterium]|nr:cobalamin-dependent protein [Pseudomonadota bacterium]
MSTAAKALSRTASGRDETPLRFVTAASLFDGHDAAINIMRRLIQAQGGEVVHLGHNRSVDDIVRAAIQEDADGIAVSSYQGGHNEFFRYMVDRLNESGAGHIRVFGGGGGTITPEEIEALMDYGVERIYHPHDGMEMGLTAMIDDLVARTRSARRPTVVPQDSASSVDVAAMISAIEEGVFDDGEIAALRKAWQVRAGHVPVVGITGTGGAGKSSLTDELIRRFRQYSGEPRIAVIAIDPTKRKTGGALLGDRIRMNAIDGPNIFFRSLSTRGAVGEVPEGLSDIVAACKAAEFDLVIVETPGIGQGDAGIVPYSDVSLYVMTPEFGAASQLEKID